mgnify:CR=1 FL=1
MSKPFFLNRPSLYYKPGIYRWLLLLALLCMAFIYNYYEIVQMRPCGIHVWRQADCLSLAMGYYQGDMNFFKPVMHNLQSDGLTTGLTAGEFPVLYYLIAVLWKLFGYHEWIYRAVVILISFIGLYSLYRLMERILKDSAWAVMFSMLVFTSPIIVYYSNNFLTNIPAWSFAIAGTYLFYRFADEKKARYLWFSMALFALSGLLKVSSLIPFLVIGFMYITESTGMIRYRKDHKIFDRPLKQMLPFMAAIAAILSWYIYAYYFNATHGGKYTFNHIWPVWEIPAAKVSQIWRDFRMFLVHQIYGMPALIFTGLSLLTVTIMSFFGKFRWPLLLLLYLLAAGTVMYFLLWYQAFDVHDYYMIDLTFLFIGAAAAFFWFMKDRLNKVFSHWLTRLVFAGLLVYGIFYENNNIETRLFFGKRAENVQKRYMSGHELGIWWYLGNHYNIYIRPFSTMEAYNRSIGIKPEDKVVVTPDGSINISLALMTQYGWTDFGSPLLPPAERLAKLKEMGARYLFVADPALYEQGYLGAFTSRKAGHYEGVDIYDLTASGPETVE